jgi:hypothetical protein
MDFENRKWSNSVGLRIRPTTWREKRPKAGVAHGHAAVAHLAEPADVPSVCTRVVTTAATGTAARVPQVDRRPRVATAVAQVPGGLRESVGHRFEDEDSLGNAVTAVWRRRAEMMTPVGGRGATVVTYRGEQACEAHNTPGFFEE